MTVGIQQELYLLGSSVTAIVLKSELFIETPHYNRSGKTDLPSI